MYHTKYCPPYNLKTVQDVLTKFHLRNKFHFSEGHGSMNAMGHVQNRRHVNFARDPLRS